MPENGTTKEKLATHKERIKNINDKVIDIEKRMRRVERTQYLLVAFLFGTGLIEAGFFKTALATIAQVYAYFI